MQQKCFPWSSPVVQWVKDLVVSAVVQVQSLAQELSRAMDAAKKKKKWCSFSQASSSITTSKQPVVIGNLPPLGKNLPGEH